MDNLAHSSNNGQGNFEYNPTKKQRKSHQRQSHQNNHNSQHQCGVCLKYDSRCKETDKGYICWNSGERSGVDIGKVVNGYRYNKESQGYGGLFALDDKNYKSDRTNNPAPKVKKLSGLNKLSLPKLSSELDKLHGQLPLTRGHLAVLRDKAPCDIPANLAKKAFSSAKGYMNLDSPISSKVAGIVDRVNKGTGKLLNLSMGDGNNDASVVLCWAFNVHGQRIGYQRWDINGVLGGEGKYTYTTYYVGNSKLNSALIKLSDKTEELPMPVWVSENNSKPDTLYLCEGFRKSFNAHLHLKANVVGYTQGMEGYEVQIGDAIAILKPKRIIFMSDTNTMANSNVFSRLNSSVQYLSELSDGYEVFVSDWGQLWSGKENTLDIDEINLDRVHSQALIPARLWSGFDPFHDTQNDTKKSLPYIYIFKESTNSGKKACHYTIKMALKANDSNTFSSVCDTLHFDYLNNVSDVAKEHQLIHRFLSKDKLTVAECAVIASSLTLIRGGAKFYDDHLHQDYSQKQGAYQNVKEFCKMFKGSGCQPINLPDSNYSLYDLVKKSSVLRLESPVTITLDEGETLLDKKLTRLLDAPLSEETKIALVKADTGIGKTNWLIEYLKNNKTDIALCFPNHKLKHEFITKLGEAGVSYLLQPELRVNPALKGIINELHSIGAGEVAHEILTKISRASKYHKKPNLDEYIYGERVFKDKDGEYNHIEGFEIEDFNIAIADLTQEELENIDNYFIAVGNIDNKKQVAPRIMTHQFYSYKADQFKGMPVIADEDPQGTFSTTQWLDIGVFTTLANLRLPEGLKSIYQELSDLVNNLKNYQTVEVSDITDKLGAVSLIKFLAKNSSLPKSTAIITQATRLLKIDEKIGVIVDAEMLPKGTNLIVTTATPRISSYEAKFKDKTNVLKLPNIALKGNLYQVTERSVSMGRLKENKNNLIEWIEDLTKGSTKITYKKFIDTFENCDKEIYFGNEMGFDGLKGKDLAVIGTPQASRHDILLAFVAAGYSLEGKDCDMANQTCFYNGCRFPFFTFKDETLRTFHFEMINEKLVQAVGRARLLRCNCTVLVISNFPLAQSQLVSSRELIEQRDIETLAIASATIDGLENAVDLVVDEVKTTISTELLERNEEEKSTPEPVGIKSLSSTDEQCCEKQFHQDKGSEGVRSGLVDGEIRDKSVGRGSIPNKRLDPELKRLVIKRVKHILETAIQMNSFKIIREFRGDGISLNGQVQRLTEKVFRKVSQEFSMEEFEICDRLISEAFKEKIQAIVN